jgi:cell division septation protein DedD
MKKADSKDKSSVLYIGKGIIIVSLVITSSLSFVLGFYVGKNSHSVPDNQISDLKFQETDTQPSQNELSSQQPVGLQQEGTKSVNTQETRKPQQGIRIEETKPDGKKLPQQSPSVHKEQETSSHKQSVKSDPKIAKENASSREPVKKQEAAQSRKYSVQAGAFKNTAEAETLKEKLSKKGYKATVITSKTKKQEVLFKVMAGEFSNRKDAELLALKLKKAEGLKPFVTFSP